MPCCMPKRCLNPGLGQADDLMSGTRSMPHARISHSLAAACCFVTRGCSFAFHFPDSLLGHQPRLMKAAMPTALSLDTAGSFAKVANISDLGKGPCRVKGYSFVAWRAVCRRGVFQPSRVFVSSQHGRSTHCSYQL